MKNNFLGYVDKKRKQETINTKKYIYHCAWYMVNYYHFSKNSLKEYFSDRITKCDNIHYSNEYKNLLKTIDKIY